MSSPDTIGRDVEMATLSAMIDEIGEGQPRVAIVGGESGVGKTRLVDALDVASGDVRFLRGNCLAFGAAIPFLPFAEIMRALLRGLDASEVAEVVGPSRGELARFIPEIDAVLGDEPSQDIGAGRLERLRLFEALLRVAERIAQDEPTVFVIEDLHWIDEASLQLLSFLVHSIQHGRMLLLITVRSETVDTKPMVAEFLADLERRVDVARVELEPLDLESTRDQIEAIVGSSYPRAAIRRIWELSDGNPLFTEELLASSDADGTADLSSPRLRDLLAARLARLPRSAVGPLRVAAVTGGTFDIDLIAAASGSDRAAVEDAADAAAAEHLLVRDHSGIGGYRFRHEIVRSTVASQLGPGEAQRIHAACAAAIQASGVGQNASPLAFHLDRAGDARGALGAHVTAGGQAERAFAYAQALDHYDRARTLWSDVEDAATVTGISRARMDHLVAAMAGREGEYDRAIALSRDVLRDHAEAPAEDRELIASSLRWYLWEAGRPEEALAEAKEAVALTDAVTPRWQANRLAHLAALLLVEGQIEEARMRAEETLTVAQAADAVEEQALAQGVLGWCLLMGGDIDAGTSRIRDAIETARRLEAGRDEQHEHEPSRRYPTGVVLGYEQLTAAQESAGRSEATIAAAREGIEVATRQGLERTRGSGLHAAIVRALFRLGRWEDALTEAEAALASGAYGRGRAALLAARARLEIGRGHFDEAEADLTLADDSLDGSMPSDVAHAIAVGRAELALWQRRPQEAMFVLGSATDGEGLGAMARPGRALGLDASLPTLLMLGARVGADLANVERADGGDSDASELVLERVRSGIRRAGRRAGLTAAWAPELAVARAELQRSGGSDRAVEIRRWTDAIQAAAGIPYLEAYARWRLANVYFGDRKRHEMGAEQVGAARALAASLGATVLVDAIDDLAGRAGVKRRSSDPAVPGADSGGRPFGLTARELEVLGLLAAGWNNNAIAESLFISPKTASVHVSNIYGKLGVESRVAAATLAVDLGLATPEPARQDDDL